MTILFNDFKSQWAEIAPSVLAACERVGASGHYILGEEVATFESAIARYCGVPHVIGVANGLEAIEISLRALGIIPGDKVISTPLSAFATTLAIVRVGGVPVYLDTDAFGLIDLDLVENALLQDPSIKFFVPVHLYGHSLDLKRIAELKARYKMSVVEDCAQSLGASHNGQSTGSAGDLAATSFYPTKNLGALGDSGAIFTSNPELDRRCRSLRDYGQSGKYQHDEIGFNSRLDELHAAVMKDALLPRLAKFTERRRQIAWRYLAEIKNPALHLVGQPGGSDSVWHLFPVLTDGRRDPFVAHLTANDIQTAIHYPTLIPEQGAMKNTKFATIGALPNATRFSRSEVSLPVHPFLKDEEVLRIINVVNNYSPGTV